MKFSEEIALLVLKLSSVFYTEQIIKFVRI